MATVVTSGVSRRLSAGFVTSGTANVVEDDDAAATSATAVTGTAAVTETDDVTISGIFIDEFAEATGTAPNPIYWNVSAKSTGSVLVQSNGQLVMQGGTLFGFQDYQYLQLGATYIDFDLRTSFYMTNDDSTQHYPRIGWHGSGVQTSSVVQTSGYCLEFSVFYDYWQVSRRNLPDGSEHEFTVANSPPGTYGNQVINWGPFDLVHVRIQVGSNTHRVKVWRNAEPEPPEWGFQLFDALYPSGVMWLSHQASGPGNYIGFERIEIAGTPLAPGEPPPPPPPNVAPTDITLSNATIEANSTSPRSIGNFTASDPNLSDIGDVHTFALVSGTGATNNNLFTIAGDQLRCAQNVGAEGTRSIRVRTTDQGGLTFDKVFTITVTPEGAWLTSAASILAAFNSGQANIKIGHGTYDFGIGQSLHLTVPNQKVIAQPGGTVTLRATARVPTYGGFGVISADAGADFCEISGEGSVFVLTQTVPQTISAAHNNDRQVCGIDTRCNDWFIHDVIVDKCQMGLMLWQGSAPYGGDRRLQRVIITRCGYLGPEFGHSGYGIYYQTPHNLDTNVRFLVEDLVIEQQTDYGLHDYTGNRMLDPRIYNGLFSANTGSALNTGGAGAPENVYMAKSEDLEMHHTHMYQGAVNYCVGKVGYGSGFSPIRFVARDTWAVNPTNLARPSGGRWVQNGTYPSGAVWDVGTPAPSGSSSGAEEHDWHFAADRAEFVGVKPLGPTWSICYGTVPGGYEQVPGTIAYAAVAAAGGLAGLPAVTIVRAV